MRKSLIWLWLFVTAVGFGQVTKIPEATGGPVGGASSLTTVNAIPKVASAGVLTESMISCTGSPLTCTVYDPTATTGATTLTMKAGAGQGTTRLFDVWLNTAGTTPGLHVQADSNVGIGTTGPLAKLEIYNPVLGVYTTSQILRINSGGVTNQGTELSFQDQNNARLATVASKYDGNAYTMQLSTYLFEPTVTLRQGNFGIGTITPTKTLTLLDAGILGWGTTAVDIALSRSAAGLLEINSGTAGKWAGLKPGLIQMQSLATPGVPTVTPTGTGGATSWGYKVVAVLADGSTVTAAGAEGTTAAGNAVLDATNYNALSWTAVTGATYYNVYRTTAGGTPATTGNLTSGTCLGDITAATCDDKGNTASGAAPTNSNTGTVSATRYNTVSNCASGASPAVCAAASSGAVALPAAGTTLTVNTTAVNATSRILITENTTVGTELSVTCNATIVRTYAVTTITAGTSFVITTSAAPTTNPACLSFMIVN